MSKNFRRLFVFLFLITIVPCPHVHAESLRNDTALKWIPDDASFFSSMLRNREQLDRFFNSRAYERLMSMPLVQMGIAQFKTGFIEGFSDSFDGSEELSEILKKPENKDLIELAKEAVSDEVFIYGADGFRHMFGLLMSFSEATNRMQIQAIANGGTDDDEFEKQMLEQVVNALDGFEVPRFVLGFRLEDTSRANAQLARLEKLIQQGIDEEPKLRDAYKKQEIDGNECLTITLTSDMIPWDEIEDDEASKQKLIRRLRSSLSDKEIVVSLGLRDNYLMLQSGKSLNALQGLGTTGGKLLIDHEKMAIVREHQDKPVTSVAYVDGEMLKEIYQPAKQLDTYVEMAQAGLERAPLDDELKKSISNDAEGFASDIKKYYPEMGAVAMVQYMTDDGVEGFSQSWAENLMIDASKPLDILSSLGGSPLLTFAFRAKEKNGEGYKMASKWLGRFRDYGLQLAEENIEEDKKEIYYTVKARTLPLLKKLDQVTREEFVPAFGDGQSAFVIDGKMESRQWHLMMPPAAEPLPMIEFAKVSAVNHPEKLKAAFSKYAEIADDALEYLQEIAKENQEELMEQLDGPAQMAPVLLQSAKIPRPVPRETSNGTVYEFKGLAQLGLDPRIAPAAGISKNRFVFSLSPTTTERLMAPQQLEADGPLMAAGAKKLGSAARIDMAGLIGLARAWTNYGMATAAELQDNDQISEMIPTVDGIMEIMQCYRSIEVASYAEADSMITQTRVRMQDLPE